MVHKGVTINQILMASSMAWLITAMGILKTWPLNYHLLLLIYCDMHKMFGRSTLYLALQHGSVRMPLQQVLDTDVDTTCLIQSQQLLRSLFQDVTCTLLFRVCEYALCGADVSCCALRTQEVYCTDATALLSQRVKARSFRGVE